ncbi:polysaccharide biosynthesis protein [Clostridium carnis]
MEEKSTGRGFLILSIAGIVGKLLSALYVPLLKGVLGETGYGIYTGGYDIFIFLIAITSLGAQPAVTKVVTELRAIGSHKDALRALKIARRYLVIGGTIVSAIFMALAYPFAIIIGKEEAALTFIFLAPAIVFAAMLAAYRGYMQGIEDMESLAISQVIEQLVNVVLSIAFAAILVKISNEWGSAGGTVGTSLGAIVAIIYIIYIFEKRDYKEEAEKLHTENKRVVSDKRIVRKLFMYAIPITTVAAVQNFSGVVDSITLSNSLLSAGFNKEEMYNLSAALSYYKTLVYVPLAIITALGTSIFPKIIQAFVHKDRKQLKRETSYAFRLTYIIAIPAMFGLAILSKEIYWFLFGNNTEVYKLLAFGSILLIFMSITTIQSVILQGINKFYLIIGTALLGIAFKIAFNIVLVPIESINIYGAMIGTIVSYLIPAIINHIKIEKFFRVKIPIIKQSIVPLICSTLMSIIIVILKVPTTRVVEIVGSGRILTGVATLVLVAIGGVIYLYTMVYFGGIRKKDLDMISPRLYRVMPRSLRKQLL